MKQNPSALFDDFIKRLKVCKDVVELLRVGGIHVLLAFARDPIGAEPRVFHFAVGYRDAVCRLHDPHFHATLLLRVVDHALDFLQISGIFRRQRNGNDFHERPQIKQIDMLRPGDIDKMLPVRFFPGAESVGIIQRPAVEMNAADRDAGFAA